MNSIMGFVQLISKTANRANNPSLWSLYFSFCRAWVCIREDLHPANQEAKRNESIR